MTQSTFILLQVIYLGIYGVLCKVSKVKTYLSEFRAVKYICLRGAAPAGETHFCVGEDGAAAAK